MRSFVMFVAVVDDDDEEDDDDDNDRNWLFLVLLDRFWIFRLQEEIHEENVKLAG